MPLAILLLLAFSNRVDVVDQVYRIPAGDWRYVELPELAHKGAFVWARYDVQGDPAHSAVRIAVMRRDDVEKLRAGLPHGTMGVTAEGPLGTMYTYVPQPGDYAVVVDNEAQRAASVHLRIWLDFRERPGMSPTQLSSERRLAVVTISLLAFCGIAGFAGWKLYKGTIGGR